ncbi:hypothetical protein D9619_009978 [Psilocybe cf. subviscida]|uniref:Alpha-type protein kinase domain-containing protein n=1 Tax=Psilocybe cf. subviscida TaxID=2480587 RepID=A0A8H5BLJ4_9AGAR|nr:hypothetical protein D9619_009978 [Psilocybe cf. subviscida]
MSQQFCESNNGDGCGKVFPNKTSSGLCAKCHKLATLNVGSLEYENFRAYKQCKFCGMAWKNASTDVCGRCALLPDKQVGQDSSLVFDAASSQLADTAVQAAAIARTHAVNARLYKQPVSIHTNAGLATAKANVTPSMDKILCHVACRVNSGPISKQKSTDPDFGSWCHSWAKEDFMSEVLDHSLETVNVIWVKTHGIELDRQASTYFISASYIYVHFRGEVELRLAGNKNFLPGDSNITVGAAYKEYHTGDLAAFYAVDTKSGKAKAHMKGQPTMGLELYINKRKLLFDDLRYVAKKFTEIGSDSLITAAENELHLTQELDRLKIVEFFLNDFKSTAKKNGVTIAKGITVSDGFLVREQGVPSAASGFPPDDIDGAVWLVEPRRSTSVIKFSGTMIHPARADNVSLTLAAFAHYVYHSSNHQLVLADIQGTPSAVEGVDGVVLFDIMTHSPNTDSGIGDHGVKGIEAFVQQHQCNHICRGLNLDKASASNENPDTSDKTSDVESESE